MATKNTIPQAEKPATYWCFECREDALAGHYDLVHSGRHSHAGHQDSQPGYMDVHWHDGEFIHIRSGGALDTPASAYQGNPWQLHKHPVKAVPA